MRRQRTPIYEDPAQAERFDAQARRLQRQFWETMAPDWDAQQNGQGLQPQHVAEIAPWLGDDVLLIGAGRGLVLAALQAQRRRAVGVDWAERMAAEGLRDGVTGIAVADAEALPFADARFDTVLIASGVLMPTHSRPRLRAYLAEASRVLAPGGALLACLFHSAGLTQARLAAEGVRVPSHTVHAQRFWDLSGIAAAAADQGLSQAGQRDWPDLCILRLLPVGNI